MDSGSGPGSSMAEIIVFCVLGQDNSLVLTVPLSLSTQDNKYVLAN